MPEDIKMYRFRSEDNPRGDSFWAGLYPMGKEKMVGIARVVDKYNNIYEGMIMREMKHGFGRLILANGEYYTGYFKYDKLNGIAVHFDNDGKSTVAKHTDFDPIVRTDEPAGPMPDEKD